MIEFALVMPIFFLLVFGTIQLCFTLYTYAAVAQAAQAGARTAVLVAWSATADQQICAAIAAQLTASGANPSLVASVHIYNTSAYGMAGNGGDNVLVHDTGSCVNGAWTASVTTYPVAMRTTVDPTGSIGIAVTYRAPVLIPGVNAPVILSDAAVQHIEPRG